MQRESVARGWVTESQFVEAYAIGQMTPGSSNLYVVPIGYQAAGVPGALAAMLGFLLPPAIVALVAVLVWSRVRSSPWPAAVRDGLMPVVIGLTWASVWALGRAALTDVGTALVAGASALILWRTPIPTPLVILGGGVLGAILLVRS